jgi:hypothetical protein
LLKDFRPQLRPEPVPSRSDIEALCHKGEVPRALKAIKHSSLRPEDFIESLQQGMRKMVLAHRANELLSVLYTTRIACPYSVAELLRTLFEHRDMPGFLKQAHRFGVREGFESEIETAIQYLISRRQLASAEAYRKKFAEIRGRSSE